MDCLQRFFPLVRQVVDLMHCMHVWRRIQASRVCLSTCRVHPYGCMDSSFCNYNEEAEEDDVSLREGRVGKDRLLEGEGDHVDVIEDEEDDRAG